MSDGRLREVRVSSGNCCCCGRIERRVRGLGWLTLFVSPRRISVGRRLKRKEIAARPAESNGSLHRRAPRGMQLLETKGLIQRKYCKARKIQRKSYGSDNGPDFWSFFEGRADRAGVLRHFQNLAVPEDRRAWPSRYLSSDSRSTSHLSGPREINPSARPHRLSREAACPSNTSGRGSRGTRERFDRVAPSDLHTSPAGMAVRAVRPHSRSQPAVYLQLHSSDSPRASGREKLRRSSSFHADCAAREARRSCRARLPRLIQSPRDEPRSRHALPAAALSRSGRRSSRASLRAAAELPDR